MPSDNRPESITNQLHTAIADLPPAYFAMVMATGIVSIACHLLGFRYVDIGLFWLNVLFYLTLWGFTAVRLILYPRFRSRARLIDSLVCPSDPILPGYFKL